MGRQVRLADGRAHYDPLITVRGLPVLPSSAAGRADRQPTPVTDSLESHFGDVATTSRRGCSGAARTSTTSSSRCRSAWLPSRRRGADRRPTRVARDDHARPHRGHPGVPDLAAARRAVARLAPARGDDRVRTCLRSRPGRRCRRRCGPRIGPTTIGRAPSRYFCGTLDAEWPTTERTCDYVSRLRAAGARPSGDVSSTTTSTSLLPGCGHRHGFTLGPAQRRRRRADELGAGQPTPEHEHRSVGSLRAIVARHRPLPASRRRERLRQPGPGRRLDRLRPERRCIEAAVLSGLQAANALLGRGRYHRIRGFYLP